MEPCSQVTPVLWVPARAAPHTCPECRIILLIQGLFPTSPALQKYLPDSPPNAPLRQGAGEEGMAANLCSGRNARHHTCSFILHTSISQLPAPTQPETWLNSQVKARWSQ